MFRSCWNFRADDERFNAKLKAVRGQFERGEVEQAEHSLLLLLSEAYRERADLAPEAGSPAKAAADLEYARRLESVARGEADPTTAAPPRLLLEPGPYLKVLANGHYLWGLILARLGRWQPAIEQFLICEAIEPEFPGMSYGLGAALFESGRYDEAAVRLKTAMQGEPANPAIKRLLGLALFERERFEPAAELLGATLPSFPDDPRVLLALGASSARTGQSREAGRALGHLLQTHPESGASSRLSWPSAPRAPATRAGRGGVSHSPEAGSKGRDGALLPRSRQAEAAAV